VTPVCWCSEVDVLVSAITGGLVVVACLAALLYVVDRRDRR
jgi:hypothetical protein